MSIERIALWDIDGTIVRFTGSKSDKHYEAARTAFGDGVLKTRRSSGMTDLQILRAIAEPIDPSDAQMTKALDLLDELTDQALVREGVELIDGVPRALDALAELGWKSSLLTGNTERRARAKLSHVGVWGLFDDAGCYGDQALSRFELAVEGARRIREARAHGVVIGDTPLDVAAAHQAGLPAVAVATGEFGVEELKAARADLVLPDLISGLDEFVAFFGTG